MKIAVIGLGAIGSQVLWQLSQVPGVEAHGYETHYPGHPTAGAGGDSRLFWNVELSEPKYAPIIVRAGEAWSRLEQEAGVPLRDNTGVLLFGKEDSAQMALAKDSAMLTGAAIEVLSHQALAQRFPQFAFGPTDVGVWDIAGAAIKPELTVATTARLAERRGARIHHFNPVTGIELAGAGATVVTSRASEKYDRIVVAAGGWTPKLLPYLKHEVVARRLTSAWYFAEKPGYFEGFPPFLQSAPEYCYGIPSRDGCSVKVGFGFNDHYATGDPDTLPRELSGEALEQQVERFSRLRNGLFPGLAPRPFRVSTYVESYTRSMLEHLDHHPESKDVVVLTGFSGHGFRAAPAIGEIGAELVLHGESSTDLQFLREAPPAFDILNTATGEASHNPVMSSYGATAADLVL